jgi:hypothetical protein
MDRHGMVFATIRQSLLEAPQASFDDQGRIHGVVTG